MRKIALVTGGSRGIGKSIVRALSVDFEVYYSFHSDESKLESIDSKYIHPCQIDSREYESIVEGVSEILGKGSISILVNNAGIVRDKTCRKMSKNEWDDVITMNLNSSFYYTQACLSSMIENGWGRIINISSIVGLNGSFGQTNYAASKAGLIGFTKSLALELATKNITVNAIAPGYIETDMTKLIPDDIRSSIIERIPMKRFGSSMEVASLVKYLSTDESAYITGQTFSISGGL
jgi:3-oxoacyl-[acyl-carrier protein] reductase